MRFLHTADWHLGKVLHGFSLLEDQSYLLNEFIVLVKTEKVDAVIIAGDIFDRSIPPAEAVNLLDDVLDRIINGLNTPVIMIAGNHDSPERLGFGARMMSKNKLHIAGPVQKEIFPVTLSDKYGEILFFPIPFADPTLVKSCTKNEKIHNHHDALEALLNGCQINKYSKARKVLLAHAFVTGGSECESERQLSVGGSGRVDAKLFGRFNYVALGHLHRPQYIESENIRYSGSLMKYSFSETEHKKSVSLIEIDKKGNATIEEISLPPKRDLRIIEGELNHLLQGPINGENPQDYLLVRLQDKGALLEAMGRLRQVYPNVMHLERPGLISSGESKSIGIDHLKQSDEELFQSFFKEITGSKLSEDHLKVYRHVIESVNAYNMREDL